MDPRFLRHQSSSDRETFNREVVRKFYREEEDYDWTKIADHFHGPETFMHRLRERELRRLIRQEGGRGRFLDLGCGSGLMLRHLPPGSVGIDLNPRNVIRARHYAPHAQVEEGDAEHLNFPDASFDAIVVTEVLEHLVFPEKACAEMFRVLRPGGLVVGSVPRDIWVWRVRRLSRTCPGNEPFHNSFRRRELKELLSIFPKLRIIPSWWLLQYYFVSRKDTPA